MALSDDVFSVLRENLVAIKPDYGGRPDVVICPLCLRDVHRDEVLAGGVEHIIPRDGVRRDSQDAKDLATTNQRCGLTVLCRSVRGIAGYEAKQGCNGFKGSRYDWRLRLLLDDGAHASPRLSTRHAVGILTMAYLGAFQVFGYGYVLRPELDEIRRQFEMPDRAETYWLESVQYATSPSSLIATATGHPFLFGSIARQEAPLHVAFRNCQAYLPGGHWQVPTGVRTLAALSPR